MIVAGSTPTANATPLRTSVAATIAAGTAYEVPSAAPDRAHARPGGCSGVATGWRSLLEGEGRKRADAQDCRHDPQRVLEVGELRLRGDELGDVRHLLRVLKAPGA